MLERVGGEALLLRGGAAGGDPPHAPGRLRDYVFTPEPVAKADFFVNCPKFKAHPWTTVTFSMKNYIGIQDDRHRLIDHDHRLNEKIADLQYIIQPQFIAIDAITAGEGRMLTPIPFPLNLVIMGDNQLAFDAVCCHLIGVDPLSVDHLRLAHERGFGPVDLDEIDVVGDVTLDEARARAKGFKVGLIRVEKYFEGTAHHRLRGPAAGGREDRLLLGRLPRRHRGGHRDPAALRRPARRQDAARPRRLRRLRGPHRREARREGGLHRRLRHLRGRARRQARADSLHLQDRATPKTRTPSKHDDIFAKMASGDAKLRAAKGDQVVRFEGCPVSVAEQVLMLVFLSGAKNPFLDPARVRRLQQGLPAVARHHGHEAPPGYPLSEARPRPPRRGRPRARRPRRRRVAPSPPATARLDPRGAPCCSA
jgi:hypothetical protein